MINPIRTNGSIVKAVIYNNSLFVAGGFTVVNGQPRSNFAEIDLTTGNLTSFSAAFSSTILNMVQFQDKIMLLGNFSSAAGIPTPNAIIMFNCTTRTFSNPLTSLIVSPYNPGLIGVTDFRFLPNTNTMVFAGACSFTQGANVRYGICGIDANTLLMNNIGLGNVAYDYIAAGMDVDPTNDIIYFARWNYIGVAGRQRVGSYNVANPNSPSDYSWVMTINPSTAWVNNLMFVDGKIFANGLRIGNDPNAQYSVSVTNAVTGAYDPQDWNIYNNLFPGVSKINKVLVRNNDAYVFGFFTHVTRNQSLRNAMYVRDKTTGIFSGDNINFTFPRVVQPFSPVYTLLLMCNEIKDAIFHEDKLYVFGTFMDIDGVISTNFSSNTSSLELNIDGTRIQKRIALLL